MTCRIFYIILDLIHEVSLLFRGILSPLLVQPGKLFSNFWGAISHDGFYSRSDDYLSIVERKLIGLWNVPFVSSAILISKHKFEELMPAFDYNKVADSDMSFAEFCRDKVQFLLF